MKRQLTLLAAAVVMLAGAGFSGAADTKDVVTLKGKLECSKCELKETAECGNVLSVKEGTKEVKYYLVDNDLSKGDHKDICTAPKDGVTVTGTVADKDGKKWVTASKIDIPK
jgi:hypothetical protein